jgi:hypothetical protein
MVRPSALAVLRLIAISNLAGNWVRLLTLVGAAEGEIAAAFATIVEQRAGALLITAGAFSRPR